mmetsp:Transcript_74000/g.128424  ORF Transcript_74000/g.128424 Transcript_74000/m.128424 type:complete len:313 (-) Transcript_74000:79-1017(-)
MNWTPFYTGNQHTPFGGPNAEKQQPEARRVLSDITPRHAGNTPNLGFGMQGGPEAQKRPMLDPQTPARRTTAFEVFEDTADVSAARNESSPPHVRPKSRGPPEEDMLHGGLDSGILGIEEVDAREMEADLPCIDQFVDPVGVQDQYWGAFGMDGPDDFGSSARLASTFGQSALQAGHEASMRDAARWGHIEAPKNFTDGLSPGDMSPGMPVAWPTPSTPSQANRSRSPTADRGHVGIEGGFGVGGPSVGADGFGAYGGFGFAHQVKTSFSPLSLPRLPDTDLDVDMDIALATPPSAAERLASPGRPPPGQFM